jgi:lysophospholipase L1-like esterase
VDAKEGVNTIYAPIDTFGQMYMQADGWHTNAVGYQLMADAVLQALEQDGGFRAYAERMTDTSSTIQ